MTNAIDCQDEDTDMRKGKGKRLTNLNVNKKVVRETGDSHPPAEHELPLYGGSDLDEQIDRLADTTNSPKVNFANSDESEPEKTGPSIGKILAGIKNNVMFNPVNRKKLVQKLEKHRRPENLNSLKIN